MKFIRLPLLVFGLILIIYACSKKDLLTNKSQDELIHLELSQDKNFQFIISNAPKRREELSKIYTSVLSQKINKASKTKASISIAKDESNQLTSLLANNIVIKNYNTHLAELRKAYPDLFVKMTKAEFLIRVYPAIKLYRQKAIDNLGVSKVSSIAETDSCMTQCDVDYQPDYDYAQFMYDDQSSFCYDPPCGQPGDPNYNTCLDEQNACIDEAWLYWMWNHWNSIDQQVTTCKMDCENIYGYPQVTNNNGMLEFATLSEFNAVITHLENDYENHNAAFFDTRDYMTDDAINAYADSIAFDEFKPLRDFENHFVFNSIRKTVENEVNAWLVDELSVKCENPEYTYDLDDEVLQTVFNQNGQVKIGNTVYNVQISSTGNCEEDHCSNSNNNCVSFEKTIEEEVVDGNKLAWKKVKIEQGAGDGAGGSVFPARLKGKIIYYKLKSNGKKKYATKLAARVYGNVYQWSNVGLPPCQFLEAFDAGYSPLKRRFRRKMVKNYYSQNVYTKFCELTGEFKINSNTVSVTLK